MIYELEKVKLFGISWLTYSDIDLIITILLLILTVLWIKKIMGEYCNLDEDFTVLIAFILMFLTGIFAVITVITATNGGNYRSHPVPLSTIDNKITVQGEKVVIDEFDKPYGYHEYANNDHQSPRNDIKQIFKFEYDELFESGKLTNENGDYYKLSKEDIKYLKEKGGK